jgi:CubicO group peptidase (beta-lactamase class C family)
MSPLKNCALLLFITSLLISPVAAQNNAAPAKARIDEYLTRLTGYGFTGGVLVVKDGEVILEKGYGLANRKQGLPFTKETVFDIGSNTKDFTKLAILQLAEKKQLNLSDPITKFFDQVPPDKAAITIQQLMDHTAGIGMYSGRDEEPVTKEEFLRRVLSAPLISEPGKEDNYSNPGYGLLAAIIEKLSGRSYEEYVHENIFKPAGMTTTGYLIPKWKDGQIARNYEDDEERPSTFDFPHLPDGNGWNLRGNGGTLSTLGDMYKFHLALEGEKLLARETKAKLFNLNEPISLVGGNGVHYFVYHREPADRIAIFVATTDAGVRATEVDQQIHLLARGREVNLPPSIVKSDGASLAKLTGAYKLPSGAELEVAVKGERLFVTGTNQEGFNLLAGGKPGNPERINKMNEQIRAVVEAAAQGDHQPLHKIFSGARPYAEFKPRQDALWQQRRERFGQLKGIKVLGTIPRQQGFMTAVRIDFERGSDYSQFIWGGGMLRGIKLTGPAPGISFYPRAATEFVNFNLATGESINLQFRLQESGNGFSLAVVSSPSASTLKASALPETPAGQLATAYLKAFNSGDDKMMMEFFTNQISKASQARRSNEERLKIFRQMRADLGSLKIEDVSASSAQALTVIMRTEAGEMVEFSFEMDEAEPQKLKAMRVDRK